MTQDRNARQSKNKTALPKRSPDDHIQTDGDWWDSSELDVNGWHAPKEKTPPSKKQHTGKSDRKLKEVHSFVAMAVGSQVVGILLGICFTVFVIYKIPDKTFNAVFLALLLSTPATCLAMLVCGESSYFLLCGSVLVRAAILSSAGPLGMMLFGGIAMIFMHIGDICLKRFGYRGSQVMGFADADTLARVSMNCDQCGQTNYGSSHHVGEFIRCLDCGRLLKVESQSRKKKQADSMTFDEKRVALTVMVILILLGAIFLVLGGPKMLDRAGR